MTNWRRGSLVFCFLLGALIGFVALRAAQPMPEGEPYDWIARAYINRTIVESVEFP